MLCLFLIIFLLLLLALAAASRSVLDKSLHFPVLQLHVLDSPVITALKGPLSEIILSCFATLVMFGWLEQTVPCSNVRDVLAFHRCPGIIQTQVEEQGDFE